MYEHQERYAKTEKGKAARRKAMDNWNAKRRMLAEQRRHEPKPPTVEISVRVASVFQLGELSMKDFQ